MYIYIYNIILAWNIIDKTILQRGHLNTRRQYQSTALLTTRPSCFTKKEASSPELIKQHCLSHSSCVNSHIMTVAVYYTIFI